MENRAGRKFVRLVARLSRPCGLRLRKPSGRAFCGGCGSALGWPTVVTGAATDDPEQSTDLGERRQVTILFADLSGYTSLAAERDPEETHRLLRCFFEAVDHAVTRLAPERHIGDNVMGVFGAPVARGDDPIGQ